MAGELVEPGARGAPASPFLLKSYESYRDAFAQNLNHFYSGLNALSLLVIILELAKSQTNAWAESFESDAESEAALARLERARGDLTGAVGLALEGARAQLPEGGGDIWLDISDADFRFLTSQRPGLAAAAYARALAQASPFHVGPYPPVYGLRPAEPAPPLVLPPSALNKPGGPCFALLA